MADNNHSSNNDSLTPRPPSSQGRYSPTNNNAVGHSAISSSVSRSPSLRGMVASPPHSPRLPSHQAVHHSRTPSFSSTLNMVDILASQASNGTKPVARDWTKITLGELVHGQKLVFVDGDTPVEEACQVNSRRRIHS
jgi:hypothetical protein